MPDTDAPGDTLALAEPFDLDGPAAGLTAIAIPRLRGRQDTNATPGAGYKRDLDETDLPALFALGGESAPAQALKRVRQSHHNLAMVLALGTRDVDAARLTGYAPSTIANLKVDPAFRELVAHYSENTREEFEQAQRRVAALGLSFVDELQARLEEAPESFSNKQLLDAMGSLLDRTILPTKGTQGKAAAATGPVLFHVEFVNAAAKPQDTSVTIDGTGREV